MLDAGSGRDVWRPQYDRPIAGLVGAPFLKRFVVRIDYAARTLTLFDPVAFTDAGRGEAIPFRLQEEIPMIDVAIGVGSRAPVTAPLYVDTGASQTIILNRPFVESNRLLEAAGAVAERRAGSLTGGASYLQARASSVSLGSIVLKDVPIGFSQDRRGSFSRTDRAGVIGNGILSRFTVTIDYPRRRMILESPGGQPLRPP